MPGAPGRPAAVADTAAAHTVPGAAGIAGTVAADTAPGTAAAAHTVSGAAGIADTAAAHIAPGAAVWPAAPAAGCAAFWSDAAGAPGAAGEESNLAVCTSWCFISFAF